jgi:hypothetical protein
MTNSKDVDRSSAVETVASVTGVLVGLTGFEHGLLETLQGNFSMSRGVIEAIGPAQRFWAYGTEPAYTLVPNFLLTGVLAMSLGLIIMIWSAGFIERKRGAWILALLSVGLFLVGGGFAPLVLAVIPVIAATQIGRPLSWWRSHPSSRALDALARLWKWVFILFVFLCLLAMIVAIFGIPLVWIFDADATLEILSTMGNVTFFGLGPLCLIGAFAHDSRTR